MAEYRKKPIVVDDYEVTEEKIIKGELPMVKDKAMLSEIWFDKKLKDGRYYVDTDTLRGPMTIREGDYIVKGTKGEINLCSPVVFKKTYEKVLEEEN